jgi:integrase
MTLAEVIVHVDASTLSASAKRDLRWAINTFCSSLGLAPIDVMADAQVIRAQIERLSPAMLGIEPGTFDNIKSALRRALRLSGNVARPRARNAPLAGPWAALYAELLDREAKANLGAFISFCSDQGFVPDNIGDPHLARFIEIMESSSINPKWMRIVKDAARAWNKAAETIPEWPKSRLAVPGGRPEPTCLAWEELPVPFREDAEAYLAYLADPPLDDDFAPAKPLRPRTLKARQFDLRHLASVLLRHGVPPDALNSVADLLKPDALDIILKYFEPEKDGSGKSRLFHIAIVLKVINRYLNKDESATKARLQKEIRRHGKKRRGMVRKNRETLAYFKDDQMAARLVTLPPRLFNALAKVKGPTERESNLALAALYIELALMWPLRVGNMSAIHLERNIIRTGRGRSARVFLRFAAEEVKNDIALEAELPPPTVQLLNLFVENYRPLLIHEPSLYLFPARDGGSRSPSTLWSIVKKVTRRYVGVAVAPHQFRHIAADFYLRARPGQYEVVRRFLGHQSIDTTTGSYAGAETDAAIRLYDENILQLREMAPTLLARRRRGRRVVTKSNAPSGSDQVAISDEPSAQRPGHDRGDEI